MGDIINAKNRIQSRSTGENIDNVRKQKPKLDLKNHPGQIFELLSIKSKQKYSLAPGQLRFSRHLRIGIKSIAILAASISVAVGTYSIYTNQGEKPGMKAQALESAEDVIRRAAYPEDKDYNLSNIDYDTDYNGNPIIMLEKKDFERDKVNHNKFTYATGMKDNSPEALKKLCDEIIKIKRSTLNPTKEQLKHLQDLMEMVEDMDLSLDNGTFTDNQKDVASIQKEDDDWVL